MDDRNRPVLQDLLERFELEPGQRDDRRATQEPEVQSTAYTPTELTLQDVATRRLNEYASIVTTCAASSRADCLNRGRVPCRISLVTALTT